LRRLDVVRVLALGSSPHTVLAVTRSLARCGARVMLGLPELASCPTAMTRHCQSVVRVPAPEGQGLVPFLLGWLEREPVDVVLPLGDRWLEPLALHAEALQQRAALAMAPAAAVSWALDKGRTVADWPGAVHPLPPPTTIAPANPDEAVRKWTFGYPAIVKPRTATGAEGIRLVRDAAGLRAAWAAVDRSFPRPLVQEFIEYAPYDKFALLYLFDAQGRLCMRYMHRMIEERRTILDLDGRRRRGGVSLIWQSAFDDVLLARGQALLEGIGWRGFAEIECVRARGDGMPRLMEVNARFPGTIGLALGQGVEFAWGACLVALGRRPPLQLDVPAGRRGRRDWLTLIGARQWRPLLRALDPRTAGANPPLAEMALVRTEAMRLLRKRWRRTASPALPGG
jgi:predicted ATP-grasp superfamily ATP-dependent carboligase